MDYETASKLALPSASARDTILENHKKEIVDARTDTAFLDACYIGGWNRCIENFLRDHENFEWDYDWLKTNEPYRLGGNMTDTDRVAGKASWNNASDSLKHAMKIDDEQELRSSFYRFNRNYIGLLAGFAFFTIGVLRTTTMSTPKNAFY